MGKLVALLSLIAVITMMTSSHPQLFASSTTEDDGYTYPDDATEEEKEEIDEQEQEEWEDAGRPGENDDDEDPDEEDPYAGLPTPEEAGETGVVDCGNGIFVKPQEPCPQDEKEPVLVLCPDGQTQVEEDRVDEDCPETNQASATGLPLCDGTFQDCVTENGDVCVAGTTAHECECSNDMSDCAEHPSLKQKECNDGIIISVNQACPPPNSAIAPGFQATSGPDNDCLYNPELLKCAPDTNGNCPDGFGTNEDGQCFVIHDKCPDEYHGHEDDESGKCISNDVPCETGYEMAVMTNGGDNCEQKQKPISCKDVPFYMTCDSQKKRNENNENGNDKIKVIQKTTVSQSASASTTATTTGNEADISNCKLDGSTDGIQQKFNPIRYQACGIYTSADKAYYDGFVAGCMQVGNTKLICETVANSNIVTPTQTTAIQPTQAIQPAAVN